MEKNDKNTVIQELKGALLQFRNDRDWEQFHTPKDLSLAIAIEAGELGERFLWKKEEEIQQSLQDPLKREAIEDELADVFNYVLCLANVLNIDVVSSSYKKLDKNAKKYPVEKAKGSAKKYSEL
jgi:dCTP diphosphatase